MSKHVTRLSIQSNHFKLTLLGLCFSFLIGCGAPPPPPKPPPPPPKVNPLPQPPDPNTIHSIQPKDDPSGLPTSSQ